MVLEVLLDLPLLLEDAPQPVPHLVVVAAGRRRLVLLKRVYYFKYDKFSSGLESFYGKVLKNPATVIVCELIWP